MAMEFLDGETLKQRLSGGPLEFDELLAISLQVVEGLSVAHEEGILHRDLKPANLFWTARGFAKILDFGLAKLEAGPADSDSVDRTATMLADDLTQEGSTVGTVAYMSPEQARGETVDARSDLFSLGTVLYELAAGRQAFGSSTTALTFDAILRQAPTPLLHQRPDLPEEFVHIVDKALEKDPAMRYQSAAELKSDLLRLRRDTSSSQSVATPQAPPGPAGRWRGLAMAGVGILALVTLFVFWPREPTSDGPVAPAAREPTIAVLPFHNMVGAEDLDYLRFAVPDEITTALSYAPALDVRPFSITRRYSEPEADPIGAGTDLKVGTVVTGQYSRESDQLQVTLEAIDVGESRVVWRDRVAVAEADLIGLRERLSATVRAGLLPIFDQAAGEEGSTPTDPIAYGKYLQSLAIPNDPEINLQGVELLEDAVELDPDYAPAWSQLSWRYGLWYAYGGGGRDAYERAIEAANRARELDPDLVLADRQLVILYTEASRLREAYDLAQALVDRKPDSAEAHFSLSYVYRYAGLLDEAAEACDRALRDQSDDTSVPLLRVRLHSPGTAGARQGVHSPRRGVALPEDDGRLGRVLCGRSRGGGPSLANARRGGVLENSSRQLWSAGFDRASVSVCPRARLLVSQHRPRVAIQHGPNPCVLWQSGSRHAGIAHRHREELLRRLGLRIGAPVPAVA